MTVQLAELLESAEKGNSALSRAVFLALGGEFRDVQINKQSAETERFPFWPGKKDAAWGVSFTTNAGDVIHYVEDRHIHLDISRLGTGWRAEAADDGRGLAEAKTFCLAVCAALVRLRGDRDKPELGSVGLGAGPDVATKVGTEDRVDVVADLAPVPAPVDGPDALEFGHQLRDGPGGAPDQAA